MHILEGKALRYALDEKSRVVSVYNRLTAHEYVYMPGELWKLIYQEGERTEIPVYASDQDAVFTEEPGRLTVTYSGLRGDGRTLDADLRVVVLHA